jgi:ABC-type dipeptide/oligopeptide/nickel transport system permease subunit
MNSRVRALAMRRTAAVGAAVLLVMALAACLAPWLAPSGLNQIAGRPLSPPSVAHPLGTNDLGYDVLSELLYGARVSLGVAASVALASAVLSWALGIAAGLWRWAEAPAMALADLLLALPNLPLAMLVVALAGASVGSLVATLVVLSWPAFARIVRAHVLAVRHAPYVEAARALGATESRVALRHVLPTTLPLLPAKLILTVRLALFTEATLTFLGLGDPGAKSWGTMLGWAFNDPLLFARPAWLWWALPPALAIAAAVVATSWVAQAFVDAPAGRSAGA